MFKAISELLPGLEQKSYSKKLHTLHAFTEIEFKAGHIIERENQMAKNIYILLKG